MVREFETEQEAFWAGGFGREYIERNSSADLLSSNIAFFHQALRRASGLTTCMEFGANVGMNLKALRLLFPAQEQFAVEINAVAAKELTAFLPAANVVEGSILEYSPDRTFDLVLIKGVLIHIDPSSLGRVYESLYRAAGRYILVCEYYNPQPVELRYRGHEGKLYKRDFCGEMLDRFDDLRLVDYGFVYHRDASFPQDDINWFLMERHG